MGASVTASSLWVLHTYCKCQCKSCDHTQAWFKHTYKRLMESLSGVVACVCGTIHDDMCCDIHRCKNVKHWPIHKRHTSNLVDTFVLSHILACTCRLPFCPTRFDVTQTNLFQKDVLIHWACCLSRAAGNPHRHHHRSCSIKVQPSASSLLDSFTPCKHLKVTFLGLTAVWNSPVVSSLKYYFSFSDATENRTEVVQVTAWAPPDHDRQHGCSDTPITRVQTDFLIQASCWFHKATCLSR